MKIDGGRVVRTQAWLRSIVLPDTDKEPKVFLSGVISSVNWYRHPGIPYIRSPIPVDSERTPCIDMQPLIVQKTARIARGCRARVTFNGKSVDCVFAGWDRPQRSASSASQWRAPKIRSSPRNSGRSQPDVAYELWPGQAAPGFGFQRASPRPGWLRV